MKELTIGNATLPHGLMLAPMAGVTDRFFRRFCAQCGAEYEVTEMVSAKALCYEKRASKNAPARSAELAFIEEDALPTAVQIFGSEPEYMAEAAAMLENGTYRGNVGKRPVAIDINMGCPVRKVVSCGEGSALMKDARLASEIVRAVKKAVTIPVTVKIRAGWDENSINAPEFAVAMEESGADLICIHGRTREQFYAPSARLEIIAKVKDAVKTVPVIGNGDIYCADDALRMINECKCDGIMVARGSLGNPWLFSEIIAALDGKEYTYPTIRERIEAAIAHTRSILDEKGEKAINEARGQLAWYIKGVHGAASARDSINRADNIDDMERILMSLIKD